MQPDANPSQPSYDFILKDQSPKQRRLIPRLGGPVLIGAIALVLIIILIIFGSLLGHKKSKTVDLADVLGQAQEIARVNGLEQSSLKDPSAIALSNTINTTLASDQAAIKNYMNKNKIKVDTKKIASYENKSTDSQLASASQNNNLDSAYESYVRTSLNGYAGYLSTAFSSANDDNLKFILKQSYDSTKTLLGSTPLKQ